MDIAQRAEVSQATVYRHFPSLAELIPACAETVFNVAGLPTPEQAAQIFADASTASERLERLVRGTCDCYGRASGWLNAARREQDLIPALGDAVRTQTEGMSILVRAALAGTPASEHLTMVLTALLDFPFWKSLRDVGVSDEAAADQVVELMRAQLAKEGID